VIPTGDPEMTTCDKIRPRLTAYLDGELADEHGSVVRGHLRECAACRQVARDESALRDGLRALAPVDPPASLWAGVQAQLAAAEVADARKPRWRRTAERWGRQIRSVRWAMPPLAVAGLVAAIAAVVVTWHGRASEEPAAPVTVAVHLPRVDATPPQAAPAQAASANDVTADVTADLAGDPARATASYDRVVEELMKLAEDTRDRWSEDERAAFDARVAELRGAIAHGGAARAVQRTQRSLIRYLQRAMVRDDVVLASGGAR